MDCETVAASEINPLAFENTPQEYKQSFTHRSKPGNVTFADYVYSNASGYGGGQPYESDARRGATLYLRVACSVSDLGTRVRCATRACAIRPAFRYATRILAHEEIVLSARSRLQPEPQRSKCDDQPGRREQPVRLLSRRRRAKLSDHVSPDHPLCRPRGDIELDGAIQQIAFEIGPSGCTTTASRNDEQVHSIPATTNAVP